MQLKIEFYTIQAGYPGATSRVATYALVAKNTWEHAASLPGMDRCPAHHRLESADFLPGSRQTSRQMKPVLWSISTGYGEDPGAANLEQQ